MANGLDKLERLFSTKKKSAASRNTADSTEFNMNGGATGSHALLLHGPDIPPGFFPQSPFIRPKANAMQPRNELTRCSPQSSISSGTPSRRISKASSKTSSKASLKASQPSPICDSFRDINMSDRRRQSNYTTASLHIPSRTSSLLSRRHEKVPGGLVQLYLPRETAFADDLNHQSLYPDPLKVTKRDDKANAPRGLLDALPIYPAPQVETPPPSDQDELKFPLPPPSNHDPPKPPVQLTPEPSPDMIPVRDSLLGDLKSSAEIQKETATAPTSRRITASSVPLLEDDWRDSYVQEPQKTVSLKAKVVFREPPVKDFHDLTVEDLAEAKVSYPSNPPPKRAPPPPILPPSAVSQPLLPLSPLSTTTLSLSPLSPVSPALASSQVTAMEAARIAKKYDFDVVYVATFWPGKMHHLHIPKSSIASTSTSTSSPTSAAPSANSSFSNSLPSALLSSPTTDRPTTASRSSTPRNSIQGSTSVRVPSDIFSPAPIPIQDCCPGSTRPNRNGPLCGSLLAGYGLETIAAPFRLSSSVHRKILRTDGWIEHRNSAAKENEFARGYAMSFYKGSTQPIHDHFMMARPRKYSGSEPIDLDLVSVTRSFAVEDPADPQPSHSEPEVDEEELRKREAAEARRRINRGLVFVAYRRPRGPDGAVNSSKAELNALEKEARALVDLILDFHGELRRWETLQEEKLASERAAR